MATTTPDSLRTPNPTDPYNLLADLAILASDVQTALNRRANMYIGTSAQRTAFTTAPDGTHWQDTNGLLLEYVRRGGAWRGIDPIHGSTTLTIGSGSSTTTASISFPSGYFSSPPQVQLTATSGTGAIANVSLNAQSVTATGFTIRLDRSAVITNYGVNWSAFPIP